MCVSTTRSMTAAEFLALPQDPGLDRELVAGALRERPRSARDRSHARVAMRLAHTLCAWELRQRPRAHRVLVGAIPFLLGRDPDTIRRLDVAVTTAEQTRRWQPSAPVVEGPPRLAVEVLASPTDRERDRVAESVAIHRAVGTRLVWILDPASRIVTAHRPGMPSVQIDDGRVLTGEPVLQGFSVRVCRLFKGG